MSADPAKLVVPHVSERLMPRTATGFNGCRVTVQYRATAYATLRESLTQANGNPKGVSHYRADLLRMRKATREPDRDGFNQGHTDELASGIGALTPAFFNRAPAAIWDALDDSVVSVAGNPSTIPGASEMERLAAARGWPRVNHQLLLEDKRIRDGVREVLIGDPMVPQSQRGYHGDWVKWDEAVAFMRSKFLENNGNPVAERYVRGAWSAAERTHDRLTARHAGEMEAAEATAKRLRQERNTARTELEACQQGQPTEPVDLDAVRKEARTGALAEAVAAVKEIDP